MLSSSSIYSLNPAEDHEAGIHFNSQNHTYNKTTLYPACDSSGCKHQEMYDSEEMTWRYKWLSHDNTNLYVSLVISNLRSVNWNKLSVPCENCEDSISYRTGFLIIHSATFSSEDQTSQKVSNILRRLWTFLEDDPWRLGLVFHVHLPFDPLCCLLVVDCCPLPF